MSAPHPQWTADDESDLRFYYCLAPLLAAGLRSSNFAVQAEATSLGLKRVDVRCTDPEEAMVALLDAAGRAARVNLVLRTIESRHAEILSLRFGDETAPARLRRLFGELAPVMVAVASELGADAPPFLQLAQLAEERVTLAQHAYARERERTRARSGAR